MAIDSDTLKKCWASYGDDRTLILNLVDGSQIVPEHVHAFNNCSIEMLEYGNIVVVPLDSILTVSFAQNLTIEEAD